MIKTSSLMRALAVTGALAGTLTACNLDEVLEVQPSSLIPAGGLETPANAAILVNGVASDFDCAFGAYVVVGALIGEEFEDALQTASRWPYDQRTVVASQTQYATGICNSISGVGIYTPLHTARVSANNVRRLLEGWADVDVPNRQLHIARTAAYEGWSTLLLGEAFCECVLSTVTGEQVNYGGRITRDSVFRAAVARLTQAVDVATTIGGASGDSIRHFALVGRARAQQNLGQMTPARADAALVPATFVWNSTTSSVSGRRNNRVFNESNPVGFSASVGARYRTLNDPRVPVQNMNRLSSGTNVPIWAQRKYTAVTSPIPVAQGAEMQLLIAEADIASNRANTLAIIAAFRAAGSQTPYTGLTAAEDLAEIIDQRRRALWLTGTHLGDIIRYNLTLSPAAGSPTPWGQTFGSHVGSQQCLPLPEVEILNNPNLS